MGGGLRVPCVRCCGGRGRLCRVCVAAVAAGVCRVSAAAVAMGARVLWLLSVAAMGVCRVGVRDCGGRGRMPDWGGCGGKGMWNWRGRGRVYRGCMLEGALCRRMRARDGPGPVPP